MEIVIAELPDERWPEAGAMAGRAFWTEDYMSVIADDPIERYAEVQHLYRSMGPGNERVVSLAAFAGDHVVGVSSMTLAGDCFFCRMNPEEPYEPANRVDEVMHEVDLVIHRLHVGLPSHAYIGPIAVEPSLQGLGIGGRLLEASWERALASGPETVALDCDPRLEGYYARHGYRRVTVEADPWGYEIVGMRRDPA